MIRALRVLSAIASITRLFSVVLLVPIPVAFLYEPWDRTLFGMVTVPTSAAVFAASFLVVTLFWLPAQAVTRRVADDELQYREAYLAVALGWLAVAAAAMIPFLVSGVTRNVAEAFFEAMSGITTTGATAIPLAPEDMPPSIVFWRGLLQWVGGLGFIVLLVALLANLTEGGGALLQAEGGTYTRIRPKLRDTARALWKAYGVLSAALAVILLLLMLRGAAWTGLDARQAAFDAVVLTFTTISSGGFSTHSGSVAFYQDPWLEGVVVVAMLLAATQFTLFLTPARRFVRTLLANAQWRLLMGTFVVAAVLVTAIRVAGGAPAAAATRESVFTVATLLTGTGHATADFTGWAPPVLILLLILMLMGGNSGSTSGAIKSWRIVVLAKAAGREFVKLLHPRAVASLRLDGRIVREEVVHRVVVFVFVYLLIWAAGAVTLTLLEPGMDALDGASASAASLGNTGLGLGTLGPNGGAASLSDASHVVMTLLMWVGRLEIFTVVLLFYPRTWRA